MYITLETDYAVRIVAYLSSVKDGRSDSRTISEKTGVPPRFTVKILRKLSSGGVVNSCKGPRGGYFLARPAKEITLLEVVELIEGACVLSRCEQEGYACRQDSCKFYGVYAEISRELRKNLERYTFDQLCGGCRNI